MGSMFWTEGSKMKKLLKSMSESLSIIGRRNGEISDKETKLKIEKLRNDGFVMLDHLVGSREFLMVKSAINKKIENEFELQFPCLAQTKINPQRDQSLIANNFLETDEKLKELKLTFDKQDIKSYQQMINDFQPTTLTVPMPSDESFFNLWLDPIVMDIVTGYMGFIPHMTEAYIRRNFPSKYKVMNHNWHRDQNHDKFLVKAFLFFTDCSLETGAHHYISASINDHRFRDKVYYSDEEIDDVWPISSPNHITSEVPAGTIIIEDTRGLHKAGIPEKMFRDLGFSIFMPPNIFTLTKPLYQIDQLTYEKLSGNRQSFVPNKNITRN